MTGRMTLARRLPVLLALILLDGQLAGAAQHSSATTQSLLQPFAASRIAGEVMSVDPKKRAVVVRVLQNGDQPRDVPIIMDDRTVVKLLPTPISGGDLEPGHLVKVTYQDHAGRLVARRIEVTGKRVHVPMP